MKLKFKEIMGKRCLSVLMTAVMTVASLCMPQTTQKAYAATSAPSVEKYQGTVSNLAKYSKVYFGKENKKWYVCGTEDGALVLLCDNSNNFGTSKFNNSNSNNNSYSDSILKTTIDGLLEGDAHFTEAEKGLMKDVNIQYPKTYSDPLGEQISVSVKLYAPYVEYISDKKIIDSKIFVGKDKGAIEMTLGSGGMNNTGRFWLRAPSGQYANMALVVKDNNILTGSLGNTVGVVPAFHLNLSSVLFASATTAATSGPTFDENNVMTFRFDSAKDASGEAVMDRIKSTATANTNGITVTKGENDDEYLYIQWNDGTSDKVYSKKIVSSFALNAECIGVDNLTNCKIWIEKKDLEADLVYAKQITSISGTGTYSHDWKYTVENNVITAKCDINGCKENITGGSLTLTAPSPNYSGSAYNVTLTPDEEWTVANGFLDPITLKEAVEYYTSYTDEMTNTPTDETNSGASGSKKAPVYAGDYVAVLKVGTGPNSAIAKLSFTVAATAVAPMIETQPKDQTVTAGDNATFTVAATVSDEGTLSYQWQKQTKGTGDWNNISDATSASYTVSQATTDMSTDQYRCIVTNTKDIGNTSKTTSSEATLTVNAAATVSSISMKINPTKIAYTVGDSLDVTGGKITVTKSDSSTQDVDITSEMVTGFDSTSVGSKTLTVTYEGKTTTFTVMVNAGYTITYNTNGGSSVDEATNQTKLPDPLPIPTKEGCTFEGWFTNEGLTDAATPGATITQDTALYVKWKDKPEPTPEPDQEMCTVKFDTNGGNEIEERQVEANTYMDLPTNVFRAGYKLKGWGKASEGNSVLYIDKPVLITTSDTLRAEWKKKSSSSSSSSTSNPETPKAQPVSEDNTTIAVDQEKFTSMIEQAAKSSEIVIPVKADTNKVKIEFGLQNVKAMEDKSLSLKVDSGQVAYIVPAQAIDLDKIAKDLGVAELKDIEFEIVLEKADKNTIDKLQNMIKGESELVGTPMTFEMSASVNEKQVEIGRFGKYVTRRFEITKEQAGEILTCAVIDHDSNLHHVPAKILSENSKFFADVRSITNSTYALVKTKVSYSDTEGKWYEGVANELGNRMITKCLDKENTNTIQGEKAITREEFAALLVNALGLPQTSNAAATFSDVTGSSYIAEIGAAYEYGIIDGVTETKFAPKKTITRQEAMVMLQRAAKITGLNGQGGNIVSFKNANKVSSWAQEAVAFNVGNGLIVGSNGEVRPQATITRAESMTATLRLLQKSNLIDVRTEA